MKKALQILLVMAIPVTGLFAVEMPAKSARPASGYALLVGGSSGSAMYAARYRDWLGRFRAHLMESVGLPEANIVTFSGDESAVAGHGPEALFAAIETMAKKVKPEDRFILFMVGHGTVLGADPGFCLPGRDLRAKEWAKALSAVASRNQLILNFSTSGGAYLNALARRGRINVTANSATEANAPIFAEFFLRGLESGRADGEGGPRDGHITVLEAFNWASYQTALWTARQVAGEEGWVVEGKETCEIFSKLYGFPGEPEGQALSPDSKPDAPDAVFNLIVRTDGTPEEIAAGKAFWAKRRALAEHALLEDSGVLDGGLTPLRITEDGKGYAPIMAVTPGDPGWLASRAVVGRAKRPPQPVPVPAKGVSLP